MGVNSGHLCKVALGLTTIANMNKWDPLTLKNKLVDVSVFEDQFDKFAYGKDNGGVVGFSGYLDMADTTGQDILRAAYVAKTNVNNIRLYYGDGRLNTASKAVPEFLHLAAGAKALVSELTIGEADSGAGLVAVAFKLTVSGGWFADALNYYTGTNVSFTPNLGANNDTIQKTAGGNSFVDLGFLATVIVEGSTSNDGAYTLQSIAANVLTLTEGGTALTGEIAGDSVSLIGFSADV
jgi:hypothetical protein